ncbi:MAG TPA: hypothetical protein VF458_13110 [Ktedonobacteraceae bacterium]
MPVTLTEAEAATTSQPEAMLIPPVPRVAPARPQPAPVKLLQSDGKLFWIITPISLFVTGCAAFLIVRRWLNRCVKDKHEHLA